MANQSDVKRWVVTGAAGFVGSHLVETLLKQGQQVVGFDNLSAGKWENLEGFLKETPNGTRKNFLFMCEDIRDARMVDKAMCEADVVLHYAAMASVPKSIENPLEAHETNVTGFLNVMEAARKNGVKRVVYASSSAVYGSNKEPVKSEHHLGHLLSPYAVTKRADEMYASQYAKHYGMETVGFRYFNIYGRRQDPEGDYAAVIPKWAEALANEETILVNGDGSTTRDFVHVSNVVDINIKAALATDPKAFGRVYNICRGEETSLKSLIDHLTQLWTELHPGKPAPQIEHRDFRAGDIHRSCGSSQKAQEVLGFAPKMDLKQGLRDLLSHQ